MKPRFSVAGLMAAVAFLALGFASLRHPTDLWAKSVLTLTLAAYGFSLLGMLFRRGLRRAFWTGFFVCGAGYLTICIGPWSDTHIMPNLVTTEFIDIRYMSMDYAPKQSGEKVWVAIRDWNGEVVNYVGNLGKIKNEPNEECTYEIGFSRGGITERQDFTQKFLRLISMDTYRLLCHANFSLLFGFIGGLVAQFLAARTESESRPRTDPSVPKGV